MKVRLSIIFDILAVILTITLLILKVCNVIVLSWFLVFLPVIAATFADILILVIFIAWLK